MKFFSEKASGAKNDRKEFTHLLDKLREGDTLCVVRLDRLGRRMIKLIEMINAFKQQGINFESLDNNIDQDSSLFSQSCPWTK